jgi:hypothetical protein
MTRGSVGTTADVLLEDAVESWGTAQTLAPGEERRWSVEVRLPEE